MAEGEKGDLVQTLAISGVASWCRKSPGRAAETRYKWGEAMDKGGYMVLLLMWKTKEEENFFNFLQPVDKSLKQAE